MYLAVVAIHVILSILLIFVILVQPGKGGDVGAAFGGAGSSTLFGPRGPTSVLSQATTVIAVGFMVTSVTLAIFSNRELLAGTNVLEELQRRSDKDAQPATEAAPGEAAPGEAAPADGAPAPADDGGAVPVELVPEDGAPAGPEGEAPAAPPEQGTPAPSAPTP